MAAPDAVPGPPARTAGPLRTRRAPAAGRRGHGAGRPRARRDAGDRSRRQRCWRGGRRWTHARGAGESGLARMSELGFVATAGDTLVVTALAGTLFFSVSATAARERVATSLLVTMVPFVRPGAGDRAGAGPDPQRPPLRHGHDDVAPRLPRLGDGGRRRAAGDDRVLAVPGGVRVPALPEGLLRDPLGGGPPGAAAGGRRWSRPTPGSRWPGWRRCSSPRPSGRGRPRGSGRRGRCALAFAGVRDRDGDRGRAPARGRRHDRGGEGAADRRRARRRRGRRRLRRAAASAARCPGAARERRALRWLSGFLTLFLAFRLRSEPLPGSARPPRSRSWSCSPAVGSALGSALGRVAAADPARGRRRRPARVAASWRASSALGYGLVSVPAVALVAGVAAVAGQAGTGRRDPGATSPSGSGRRRSRVPRPCCSWPGWPGASSGCGCRSRAPWGLGLAAVVLAGAAVLAGRRPLRGLPRPGAALTTTGQSSGSVAGALSRSSATARSTVADLARVAGGRGSGRAEAVDTSSSSLIRSSTMTAMSSGGLRLASTTDGSGSSTRTGSAWSARACPGRCRTPRGCPA